MCGIAGIVCREGGDPDDPARLQEMTRRIAHRGPDDSGHASISGNPSVLLGHRRLAVVDLTDAAHQPFIDETGELVLVYNGEIFNYVELRRELQSRGYSFHSESDTEVLLRSYQAWGTACVEHFNGMWAFALWDSRKQELFCSRDRFGIKPFYYWSESDLNRPDRFVFASEVKAVLAGIGHAPVVNGDVLADYLMDGRLCLGAETLFSEIVRLPAAHNLVLGRSGVQVTRYWDYGEGQAPSDDEQAVELFRELLEDAVHLRLRGDVPIGSALSGGLDSASILALASHGGDAPQEAFTAVFPDEWYDETDYARSSARDSGANLTEVPGQGQQAFEDLHDVVWALDYPARDGQVLSRWRLIRAASKRVKILLEGQGADELLAGYSVRYIAPYLLEELYKKSRFRPSPPFGELVSAWRESSRRRLGFAAGSLIAEVLPTSAKAPLRRIWNSERALSPDFVAAHGKRQDPNHHRRFSGRLNDRLHFDHQTGILPMLLKMGDALSMAHSVESRLPFLDYRLVEFAFALESRHKFHGPETKPILRRAMRGLVPEQILGRRDKIGFITPTARWLHQEMDRVVRPLLSSQRAKERGIVDHDGVESALRTFEPRQVSKAQFLFRLVQTEVWFQLFVDSSSASR